MAASSVQSRFPLNPLAGLAVHHVGIEREPVIVVDDAMVEVVALIDYAATQTEFTTNGLGGYPGVRAPAPLDYVETLVRRIDPVIRSNFGLRDAVLDSAECSFSIVTTPPRELAPFQRLPHVDTSYPLQFAVLHYLCDGRFGGTGFFRHKRTGFETINTDREAAYSVAVERDLETSLLPPGYLGSDPPHHILTGAFEALLNRIIIYRSCLLHCGLIPDGMTLTTDPRRGRLTANIFVNYGQK